MRILAVAITRMLISVHTWYGKGGWGWRPTFILKSRLGRERGPGFWCWFGRGRSVRNTPCRGLQRQAEAGKKHAKATKG